MKRVGSVVCVELLKLQHIRIVNSKRYLRFFFQFNEKVILALLSRVGWDEKQLTNTESARNEQQQDNVSVVGLCFTFTIVKMQGPNKPLNH